MNTIYTNTIQLKAQQDWFCHLTEKVDNDKLLYSINYKTEDESKVIFAELIGDGSSKLVRINLNTNKGIKTGEFNTSTTFANIYFQIERIRFYTEFDIEFNLTLIRNQ